MVFVSGIEEISFYWLHRKKFEKQWTDTGFKSTNELKIHTDSDNLKLGKCEVLENLSCQACWKYFQASVILTLLLNFQFIWYGLNWLPIVSCVSNHKTPLRLQKTPTTLKWQNLHPLPRIKMLSKLDSICQISQLKNLIRSSHLQNVWIRITS